MTNPQDIVAADIEMAEDDKIYGYAIVNGNTGALEWNDTVYQKLEHALSDLYGDCEDAAQIDELHTIYDVVKLHRVDISAQTAAAMKIKQREMLEFEANEVREAFLEGALDDG